MNEIEKRMLRVLELNVSDGEQLVEALKDDDQNRGRAERDLDQWRRKLAAFKLLHPEAVE